MSERAFPRHAVAIVGLAGRFPGAPGLDGFWDTIRSGKEVLESFSDEDIREAGIPSEMAADPRYVKQGTVLPDSKAFDAQFFGLSPREAQVLDPQHRIFLECAWEAMEHAGYAPGTHEAIVGVYGAASMNTYLLTRLSNDPELVAAVGGYQVMLGNDKDFLCTRASYKLDLKGPSMTVQTACSSSLVAVEAACRALSDGECDMALAGGVSVMFPERSGYLFQEGMIFSPDGHCRPFDADAAGTRAGAGAGIVALKRLEDAQRDGDTIHAVIRGIAVNNDGGAKAGYTAPSLDGQVEVIATAHALAEVEPASIGYVEAHGTATPLGDPIEMAALTRAFRAGTDEIGFCSLGSLKANLGHLDAAAGVAGLIKTVMVLKNGEIPPLVNFRKPSPALNLETSPFSASGVGHAWAGDGPRRAGVSSFGIGGTNVHAVLEQAPVVQPAAAAPGWQLLPISAKTENGLAAMAETLADHFAVADSNLGDAAWTLQSGRAAFPHRRFVVADGNGAASESFARHKSGTVHDGGARKVAFLFSGQGAQHTGMGESLYREHAVYRDCVDRCAELLLGELGLDLREAMFGNDADLLRDTRIAQPALFVTEIALAELLAAWGIEPAGMIGHSIGEFAAATLAGVFTLEEALKAVATRGRLMSSLPPGAMAGVALPEQELPLHLAPGVEIAAINAPSLCTISGPADAVAQTIENLAAIGVEARPLHTSHAFHSAMMEPVLDAFRDCLAGMNLNAPTRPYVSSLTGNWITAEQAVSPDYYADQLRRPVRFAAGLTTLAQDQTLFLLEIGPGTALGQLARQNLAPKRGSFIASSLPSANSGAQAEMALLEAVGQLWSAGVTVNFAALHAAGPLRRIPLPTYRFQRETFDANASLGQLTTRELPARRIDDQRPQVSVPGWTRSPRSPESVKGTWLVAGGSEQLCAQTAAALAADGADTMIADDYKSAADAVCGADGAGINGLVLLDGIGDIASREHFDRLFGLTRELAASSREAPLQMLIAAQGSQRVLDETVTDPQSALPLGVALALPLELAWLNARLVDMTDVSEFANRLALEAAYDDREPLVAWRGGQRWMRTFSPLLGECEPDIREGGVYLITGGTGGIGLSLAQQLAERWNARILLTSRRAETGDQSDLVRAIEPAGGEVLIAAADASDEAAMHDAVEQAQKRWGRIDGVIHAAGIAGTGKIAALLSADEVAATLSPKIDGLSVLLKVFGEEQLDFVALLGSINGVLGVPGSVDYSAANAVLDSFADGCAHPAGWRRVVTVDFSAWRSVGMAHAMQLPGARGIAHREQLNSAITTEEGVAAFFNALGAPADRLVVTAFDLRGAIEANRNAPSCQPTLGEPGKTAASRRDQELPGGEPATPREERVAALWCELIGVDAIGRDDDFFNLGGHSLLATRLLSRIRESENSELQLRHIFENPTLKTFAAYIDTQEPAGGTDSCDDDDREEMIF